MLGSKLLPEQALARSEGKQATWLRGFCRGLRATDSLGLSWACLGSKEKASLKSPPLLENELERPGRVVAEKPHFGRSWKESTRKSSSGGGYLVLVVVSVRLRIMGEVGHAHTTTEKSLIQSSRGSK